MGMPYLLAIRQWPPIRLHRISSRCKEFGIDKIFSLPYHPQGNGVIESFHQFLIRSVSAYIGQTSWPLVDVVASVLMAYRSTPHPVTNESPYRLMTGLDMVLPNFQEWAEYSVDNMDAYRRFNLLAQVRRDCLDRVLRNAAYNHQRHHNKTKVSRPLQVGDLVIYWLNPSEVSKLLIRFGSMKFAPRWSEPCRIQRFLNQEKTVMIVKSIWHKGIVKKVHQNDVMPLPTQLTAEALNMAKFELVADLKKHAALSRPNHTAKMEFMNRIPAEDRKLALDHMDDLDNAWKEQAKVKEGHNNGVAPENGNTDRNSGSTGAQENKKRRAEIHAMWTYLAGEALRRGGLSHQ